MKYKAYQIAPEYQESPLFSSDKFFPDNIAVCGNRDYIEHCPEVFEHVYEHGQAKEEIAEALGVNTADIVLYWFNGWAKTEKYREEV